jgi:hypothetical protein
MKPPNTLSVLETAVKLKTSERSVLAMIANGEIQAINNSKGKKRPRWAILQESIESLGRKPQEPAKINVPRHV